MSGRVVVVGALNVDRRLDVDSLPGPGETVRARSSWKSAGGKGANQAASAAAAGAPTVMIGSVGDDPGAAIVLGALERRGVVTAKVARIAGAETGEAMVVVDRSAENSIVVSPGANGLMEPVHAVESLRDLGGNDVVVLQNELPSRVTFAAARWAAEAGARVIWNAAPAPSSREEVVDHADVVLCNEHECARVAELLGLSATDLDRATVAVAQRLGAVVVCTVGAAGAIVADESSFSRVAAPQVPAVDTTGAGDTFAGYLAAGLLAGVDLLTAARTAVMAAALSVTRRGAADAAPSAAEVQAFIERIEIEIGVEQ